MKRRVFFSFHYKPDSSRAGQVRNIGMVEGNPPVSDNDWETVKSGGKTAIKKWIADQMHGRSCTVVLVGSNTAARPLVKYEIIESWNDKMGVVGIHIHGLKNLARKISVKGSNPFTSIPYGNSGKKLSSIVKCYNPAGSNSKERYDWIAKHLGNAVSEAIQIRKDN